MLPSPQPAVLPRPYKVPASTLLCDLDSVFTGNDGRIPFAPRPLCDALRGGMGEEFILIGAQPAAGKTDLVINIALAAARRRKVVIASFEIPDIAVVRRSLPCLSCVGGAPLTEEDFAKRDALPPERAEACRAAVEHASRILDRVVIVDDRSLGDEKGRTIEALAEAVHALAVQDGIPPVLIVDYVQLVKVATPAFSVTDVVDRVSRGLAQIAHGERTPVIAIACLGKDGNLRSSSQLTFDPDVILRLSTESFNDDGSRDVTVEVQKFRDGKAPQTIPLMYWPAFHYFSGPQDGFTA